MPSCSFFNTENRRKKFDDQKIDEGAALRTGGGAVAEQKFTEPALSVRDDE